VIYDIPRFSLQLRVKFWCAQWLRTATGTYCPLLQGRSDHQGAGSVLLRSACKYLAGCTMPQARKQEYAFNTSVSLSNSVILGMNL
jgi:hypothetical protein